MLTSQDYWTQHVIACTAIKADIRNCASLLFSRVHGNWEEVNEGEIADEFLFDETGSESFRMTEQPDFTVMGVKKNENDYITIIGTSKFGETLQFPIEDENLCFTDHVGILERLQWLLDDLKVDYRSYKPIIIL